MSDQITTSAAPHPYPGKLIIVEGIDGSGKSTQLVLLHKWLESKGHKVFFTEWNSSELVKDTTKRGKKNKSLTPTTFSLLHATDFASRLYHEILPPLKAGMLVLADRYMYTAFARDVVRGVSPEWVRKLYSFAIKPDMAFYFKVPIEVAINRLLGGTRGQFKFYEAGMDMNLSQDQTESFRIFQSRILAQYDKIVDEYQLIPMDATKDIAAQQEIMRRLGGPMVDAHYFGDGLTYLNPSDLKGKLIAIEGTDGVGRSTHIELLQEWLEVQGYGVITTGWTRSNLMSKTIEMAKEGNILDRWSLSLLYATDFADRLEHQIIPALRSGFIVLADRYIYTAFARDYVRSNDRKWIRDVFGFALVPDLVCYLRIDVETLVLRVIETKAMNYWESGMDLRLGNDLYDSFKKYQSLLIEEFDKMTEEFKFEVVDARKSPEEIQDELRTKIQQLLTKEGLAQTSFPAAAERV
jgi:dTMP kinase